MTAPCQGPDPHTRQPRLEVPAGACDCHAHVFAPLSEAAMVAARAYTPPPAPLEAYRHMLSILGIQRAVIVQPSVYGTDNRVTMAAVRAYGRDCRAVVVVDPGIVEAELKAMDAAGARGVRLNLQYAGGVGLDAAAALARRIAPLGWHLQLLLDARDLPDLLPAIRALPVEVVVDHMGHMSAAHGIDHPGFRALLEALAGGRCWVKLSGNYRITAAGAPYDDAIPFARALVAANPERCVWGTDWPHPALEAPMPNDADLLDALAAQVPDEAARARILVDNPARLYRFDG